MKKEIKASTKQLIQRCQSSIKKLTESLEKLTENFAALVIKNEKDECGCDSKSDKE